MLLISVELIVVLLFYCICVLHFLYHITIARFSSSMLLQVRQTISRCQKKDVSLLVLTAFTALRQTPDAAAVMRRRNIQSPLVAHQQQTSHTLSQTLIPRHTLLPHAPQPAPLASRSKALDW